MASQVDLYAALVDLLMAHGVDVLGGRRIADVSSEEFDFLTRRFVADEVQVRRVEQLFEGFCETQRASVRSVA